MPFPQQLNDARPLPATGRGPRPGSQLPELLAQLATTAKQAEGLAPLAPSPRYDLIPPPAEPFDPTIPGAITAGVTAATAFFGPKRVWVAGKWVWRYVIFGRTIKEGAEWFALFQEPDIAIAYHHLTSFFLGIDPGTPIYTRDYSFLERKLHGIPGNEEQRQQAIRYSQLTVSQLQQRIDELEAGRLSNVALLEERTLIERIISIKLDQEAAKLKAEQAHKALATKAQQVALSVWSLWQESRFDVNGEGQLQGAGPPGSIDP